MNLRVGPLRCSALLLIFMVIQFAVLVPRLRAAELAHAGSEPACSSCPNPAYTLPPDKLAKAEALDRDHNLLWAASTVWSFVSLLLILEFGGAGRLRDVAVRATRRPWLQGLVFLPPLLLLLAAMGLPLGIVAHHIGLEYGLSIERWRPWIWDWTKGVLVSLLAGTAAISILFAIVRHARRTWWLWFWLVSLPLIAATVYLVPLAVDPLFNHFEPLSRSNPALVAQLEQVVRKSGESIPPARMFLMRASEKVTGLNAYVTGFGGSKRVVVWDTSLQKSTPDEVLFIFGHELGHYVLGDVIHGLLLAAAGLLLALWLAYYAVHWAVRRFGVRWSIPAVEDWGAVVVLLLAFNVFGVFSEPVSNAVSRRIEHRADVYGQEIIHGIVPNPQQTAQRSFQTLGQESLDVPDPNALVVFWTYSHPPIAARAAFARDYDPWMAGLKPRFFAATK